MRRQALIDYRPTLPASVVALEACWGANHLNRLLWYVTRDHELRLVPPEYGQPYIKVQKNDTWDATEAVSRPTYHAFCRPYEQPVADGHLDAASGAFSTTTITFIAKWVRTQVSFSICKFRSG